MTRLSRIAISLVVAMMIIAASLLSLRYLPLKIINGYEIRGCETTYEISKMLSPLIGRSFFQLRLGAIKSNLEELPYISNVSAGYAEGKLFIDIVPAERGLILESSSNAYFLQNDVLSLVNARDSKALERMYIKLNLGDGYLNYMIKYGFDSYFEKTINALTDLNNHHNLIDKAEYDNNKSTGRGELTLTMNSLKAKLRVSDALSSNRLESAIAVIKEEQWKDGRSVFLDSPVNYELRSGQLIRLKG